MADQSKVAKKPCAANDADWLARRRTSTHVDHLFAIYATRLLYPLRYLRSLKMKLVTTIVAGSLLIACAAQADAQAPAAPPKIGLSGLVVSTGLENHELNGRNGQGVINKLRYFYALDTYPLFLTGLDVKYGRADVAAGGSTLDFETSGVGILLGSAIPLGLFGVHIEGAPRGLGPLVYVVYNFEQLTFDNPEKSKAYGNSIEYGIQAGYPVRSWLVVGARAEYSDYRYRDKVISQLGNITGRLDRSGWAYSVVLGFPVF